MTEQQMNPAERQLALDESQQATPSSGVQAAVPGGRRSSGDAAAAGAGLASAPAAVARHESRADGCRCGCGRPVPIRRRGPTRLYATDACRAAVYRRNRAGVPADLPRQPNDHSRRSLAATSRT